jgi:hypothetical protein
MVHLQLTIVASCKIRVSSSMLCGFLLSLFPRLVLLKPLGKAVSHMDDADEKDGVLSYLLPGASPMLRRNPWCRVPADREPYDPLPAIYRTGSYGRSQWG